MRKPLPGREWRSKLVAVSLRGCQLCQNRKLLRHIMGTPSANVAERANRLKRSVQNLPRPLSQYVPEVLALVNILLVAKFAVHGDATQFLQQVIQLRRVDG